MKVRTLLHQIGMVAFMVIAFTLGVRALPAQAQDSDAVSKLLVQAKSEAVLAEQDADLLHSYTMSKLSWQSHADKLTEIADHINALGKLNKDLAEKRALGSAWQQKAVDQIDPLLKQMANQLTATINHIKVNPTQVNRPAYREYTQANYELARKTAGMIRDFVDYDEAQSRAQSLEAKLELSEPEKND